MTQTSADRDRVTRAFAQLGRHAILACGALAGTAQAGHAVLRARPAARYPPGGTAVLRLAPRRETNVGAAAARPARAY
jgi:hypothetical protein